MSAILGALGAREGGPRVALGYGINPFDAWIKREKVCVWVCVCVCV